MKSLKLLKKERDQAIKNIVTERAKSLISDLQQGFCDDVDDVELWTRVVHEFLKSHCYVRLDWPQGIRGCAICVTLNDGFPESPQDQKAFSLEKILKECVEDSPYDNSPVIYQDLQKLLRQYADLLDKTIEEQGKQYIEEKK